MHDNIFQANLFGRKDHKLISCYEILELDKTPLFAYNRWSLWTPAKNDSFWVDEVKTMER